MERKFWIILFYYFFLLIFFFLRGMKVNSGCFSINIVDSHNKLIFPICTLQIIAVVPQVDAGSRVGTFNSILQEVLWCYATEIFSALAQWWKKWLNRTKRVLKSPTTHQILVIAERIQMLKRTQIKCFCEGKGWRDTIIPRNRYTRQPRFGRMYQLVRLYFEEI